MLAVAGVFREHQPHPVGDRVVHGGSRGRVRPETVGQQRGNRVEHREAVYRSGWVFQSQVRGAGHRDRAVKQRGSARFLPVLLVTGLLAGLRDTLLPKLLGGQVRIANRVAT